MSSALIWGIGLGALLTLVTASLKLFELLYMRRLVRAHVYLAECGKGYTQKQANNAAQAIDFLAAQACTKATYEFINIAFWGDADFMLQAARDQGFDG